MDPNCCTGATHDAAYQLLKDYQVKLTPKAPAADAMTSAQVLFAGCSQACACILSCTSICLRTSKFQGPGDQQRANRIQHINKHSMICQADTIDFLSEKHSLIYGPEIQTCIVLPCMTLFYTHMFGTNSLEYNAGKWKVSPLPTQPQKPCRNAGQLLWGKHSTGCIWSVDLSEEVNARYLLQETDGAQADATGLEGCASHYPCKLAEAAG